MPCDWCKDTGDESKCTWTFTPINFGFCKVCEYVFCSHALVQYKVEEFNPDEEYKCITCITCIQKEKEGPKI